MRNEKLSIGSGELKKLATVIGSMTIFGMLEVFREQKCFRVRKYKIDVPDQMEAGQTGTYGIPFRSSREGVWRRE